jgi:ArsR family transcriptional regulator, virulence genes transcriptional regulator
MQVQEHSHEPGEPVDASEVMIPEELRPLITMHAGVCNALANQHRLAIMYCLSQGEMSVGGLAHAIGISVHLVSQHLRVLKSQMLVQSRREAQTIHYSLANPKFIQACQLMCQAIVEQHQAAGESLLAVDLLERLIAPAVPEREPPA